MMVRILLTVLMSNSPQSNQTVQQDELPDGKTNKTPDVNGA